MNRVVVSFVFLLASVASPLSEEAQKIGEHLAAMKAKTHRNLTAAKDVTPLIERIDKDLLVLTKQKQQLAQLKQSLAAKKRLLEMVIDEKSVAFNCLQEQYNAANTDLVFHIELLGGLRAQRSIQSEAQVLAQEPTRATLLAHVFASKLALAVVPSLDVPFQGLMLVVEDVRG